MGRKVQEFRPNVVLSTAIYSGLSALVNLAYKRKNDQTAKFYHQISNIWERARKERKRNRQLGSHDFSEVQNIESVLRNLYLKMLWKSTQRYGNKERKRVYSWREGTVGLLNALLNFAGSVLRDILVPRYPFPESDLYEIREYPDGRKKILSKKIADKTPREKNVKTYIRAGYRGNSKYPCVLLAHPTLPALDFGDMIRAHLVELCRQCFIYNVPRIESQRYIRLLVHRLTPYLDWIYTQGNTGRKNFSPGADKELRKIVLEIRTQYGTKLGREEGISRKVERITSDVGVEFLIEKIESIMANSEEYIREKCETILNHIENGLVTDIEVSRFIEDVTKKSAREGNDWHRVLLSGFSHPRSLREVIFAGDSLLETPSGLQYLAEVPVKGKKGLGKIDLTLFARAKRKAGQYIWTPVLILEIKTKVGFNFNLYGKRPRTKKPNVFVPVLNAWKRSLTEHEWNTMTGSVPPQLHLFQLDAYEEALLSEYNALVGDVIELRHLWKGIVTLDITQDFSTTKSAFDKLVEQLAGRMMKGDFNGQWKTLTIESESGGEEAPRIAVTMTPATGDISILKSINSTISSNLENPFKERVEDDIFFTQYVSVPSPTSSGKSAAWLAKNWHLLNHLAELEETTLNSTFFWVDLLGDYPTKRIIMMRFGLDALRKKKMITKPEHSRLGKMLARIRFVSIREETDSFLFDNDSAGIGTVRDAILKITNTDTKRRIIVIDGWSELEKMLPTINRKNLPILEITLLRVLKETAQEVIWVDDGIDHPLMNKTYQRSCVSPLFYSSPRKQVVDEILWNLPTAPRKIGWLSPQYDDSRVIIQDLPVAHPPWITVISVPHLKGWTKKFNAATIRDPVLAAVEYLGEINQQQSMYGRSFKGTSMQVCYDAIGKGSLDSVKEQALTLIPSLRRKRQEDTSEGLSDDWVISYTPVNSGMVHPSLKSRLRLDVIHPLPTPNRSNASEEIYVDAEDITRGWMHKTLIEDDDASLVISRRPPHAYSRIRPNIDTLDTRRREVRRIVTAAEYLARTTPHYDSLFSEIVSICHYEKDDSVDDESLLTILQQIREAILRKSEPRRLWQLLLSTRLSSADLLNVDSQRVLRQAQNHNSELLELYGMNLFLAIVSVAENVLKKVESPICKTLWSVIARWQFYQMGFEHDNDFFEQRYDFQTIHANLTWRAKQMEETTPLTDSRFTEQFGQLLWREGSDEGNSWLLFPSFKSTMFGIFLENQMSAYLRQGWYRGVIDSEQIKEKAEDALSRKGWSEFSIVLVDVNMQRVLFVKSEGEDGEEWNLVGAFEYGNPPKDQSQPVRWIRLAQPRPETFLALHGFTPSVPPTDIQAQCNKVLKEASEWIGVIRDVTCFLTMDIEKRIYRIDLLEGSTTIAQKETTSTDEVISFLRYPLRKGEYFTTSDGTYLRWNPLTDIEYGDFITKDSEGKLDLYSFSIFKPLIHRSSFIPDSYALPSTCEEFIATEKGVDITLRIVVDEQVKNIGTKKYLKVQVDELKKSGLVHLENEDMGIFDVALLSECEQLVDIESGKKHNVSINAESLVPLRLVHLLSEYPNLQSTIMNHIEDLQIAEADEYEEDWDDNQEYEEPDVENIEPEFEEGLEEE